MTEQAQRRQYQLHRAPGDFSVRGVGDKYAVIDMLRALINRLCYALKRRVVKRVFLSILAALANEPRHADKRVYLNQREMKKGTALVVVCTCLYL